MSLSLDAAAEVFREAMREAVRRRAFWYQLEGLVLIGTGLVSIVYPFFSSIAVVVLIGWLLIVAGLAHTLNAVGTRYVPHFWLELAAGLLAMLIGMVFLRNPANGLMTMAMLLVVFFLVEGMSRTVFALTIRPFPNWLWVLASGLLGIALSLALVVSLPIMAPWLIGTLLGVELLAVGSAMAYLAYMTRRDNP